MALTFGGIREGRIKWRRELPPVIAVAGLAADYLSPAALWTILLPLGAVVLLLTMRKWAIAATVLLLSSWMLIPLAAGTVSAIEESRGERNIWLIDDGSIPNLDEAVAAADSAGPGRHRLDGASDRSRPSHQSPLGDARRLRDLRRPAQRHAHRPLRTRDALCDL